MQRAKTYRDGSDPRPRVKGEIARLAPGDVVDTTRENAYED
jgi:hypothetical protein